MLPQKEEFEWRKYEESIRRSMRKETALVPCMPQPAPEAYARNKGLCGCIFWLSEKPEVECFYSWVLFYTLC